MKRCKRCGTEKPLDQFYPHHECRQGVRPECIVCFAALHAARRDPAKNSAYNKRRYTNPEYVKRTRERANAWGKANREKASANVRKHYERNPDKARMKLAKRRAAKLRREATWGNRFFIAEAYRLATLRSKVTGVPWVVDHVIPLRGERVSGLHVHDNLQVIEKVANSRKSNRFGE